MRNYSKRLAWLIIATFLFSVSSVRAAENSLAPEFRLPDIQNKIVSSSNYKDKQSLLLFFWTTWCPFCRSELKLLNDKYAELQKDGIELLTINVGEPQERVQSFASSHGLILPALLDKDTTVANSFELIGVPTYILINKQGYIVSRDHRLPDYKNLISK